MDFEPVILEIGPGMHPVEKTAAAYIDKDPEVFADERYHLVDALQPLPWPPGTFDRVVTRCFDWFYGHQLYKGMSVQAFDWIRVVAQWMEVLKPEGILKELFLFTDEQLYTDQKDEIDPRWGVTPRELMNEIGIDALKINDQIFFQEFVLQIVLYLYLLELLDKVFFCIYEISYLIYEKSHIHI